MHNDDLGKDHEDDREYKDKAEWYIQNKQEVAEQTRSSRTS